MSDTITRGTCPNDTWGHAPHTTGTGETRCALCNAKLAEG